MTYRETLDFLYAQLPMYQRQGASAYKKDLGNTIALCEYLGHPEKNFKSIHIAGTNGKGSCSHMLAAIFQQHGYKTGLYTSPHLVDFRERIRINGQMIPEEQVIRFTEDIRNQLLDVRPSFFELTVAMAFDFFAREKVDIAIIETGLGGRLDSTNVIIPELSVITNIGWDHMDMLGDTLPKIAFEKAGIIKEKVPIVIGEKQEETISVFEEVASDRNAELLFAEDALASISLPESDLKGNYQQKNIRTVLAAVALLKEAWKLNDDQVRESLKSVGRLTGLQGRWQEMQSSPRVIADVAHNKNGLEGVMQQIHEQKFEKLYMVIGMVKEKDLHGILPLFPNDAHYLVCEPEIPRKLPSGELFEKMKANGFSAENCTRVKTAYQRALQLAGHNDLIFVGGSSFVVADLLSNLQRT